jgi:SAM-dependent methyltransferase
MQCFHDKYLAEKTGDQLTILDLGSMDVNGSYRSILQSKNWTYTGVDMEAGNGVDIVLKKPYQWDEIKTDSIDVFVSGQAFEHIEFFWISMLEVFRVLKPGGICCIIAPAGGYEHKYPVDCWRFYPDGFSSLARFAQMRLVDVHTQWESLGFSDDSEEWMDTVLVAEKPILPFWVRIKSKVKCFLQHRIMSLGLEDLVKRQDDA